MNYLVLGLASMYFLTAVLTGTIVSIALYVKGCRDIEDYMQFGLISAIAAMVITMLITIVGDWHNPAAWI